jgi:rhodanese-related sulfurtransferase
MWLRLVLMLAVGSGSLSCRQREDWSRLPEPPAVSMAQLEEQLRSPIPPVLYDVNSSETRAKFGVIPGARLLSHSRKYEPRAELPPQTATPLVFYCANTACRASDNAAKRATQAGYSDVRVMRDGIRGWVEAGKPTAKPSS